MENLGCLSSCLSAFSAICTRQYQGTGQRCEPNPPSLLCCGSKLAWRSWAIRWRSAAMAAAKGQRNGERAYKEGTRRSSRRASTTNHQARGAWKRQKIKLRKKQHGHEDGQKQSLAAEKQADAPHACPQQPYQHPRLLVAGASAF